MKLFDRTLCTLLLFIAVVAPASAYIGPGAGLSLLGALWGLLAAIGAALLFVIAWPFRRMLRQKREHAAAREGSDNTDDGTERHSR